MMTLVSTDSAKLTVEDLKKAMDLFAMNNPRVAWRNDHEACVLEDQKKGRGHLVINPEWVDSAGMDGDITEKDGVEYRIVVDENMRGMRTEEGEVTFGYWTAPNIVKLDPLISMEPLSKQDEEFRHLRSRFMTTADIIPHLTILDNVDDAEDL